MVNIIEIRNLIFKYRNKLIFNELNLNIKEGKWVKNIFCLYYVRVLQ